MICNCAYNIKSLAAARDFLIVQLPPEDTFNHWYDRIEPLIEGWTGVKGRKNGRKHYRNDPSACKKPCLGSFARQTRHFL